ncbi:type III restriction-modification system endonuclease [Turicibacter sanguinis]|uniref:type III restriction-modification system endonuclease n=1 Tax=Turicibacter sanguinis TaxID=154288 RepID=UPI00325B49F3
MEIKLQSSLEHQRLAIKAITSVIDDVDISVSTNINQNPIINLNDERIKENISIVQSAKHDSNAKPISSDLCISNINSDFLNLDVKMETGTGKTYVYTKMMYEMHKRYGFNKFIILVPSTPIKEGVVNFISSNYAKKHFSEEYKNTKINLNVLNAQKSKSKGVKLFPVSIADFAKASRYEKNKINVLLMTGSMLLSKKTMDYSYDQTFWSGTSVPYDVIKETRPIVIIDEPHRFQRSNNNYRCIIERLKPQLLIRFGATFPELSRGVKDYENLIYNLNASESFNNLLVKGIEVEYLPYIKETDVKIKLMSTTTRPKRLAIFRNETTKKSYTFSVGQCLSELDHSFEGISIDEIGQEVVLSNGHIIKRDESFFAGIYDQTYQELMMALALDRHFEKEKMNFMRSDKIKTLALFFIDSVYSYRGDKNDGPLKLKFENMLKEKLISQLKDVNQDIANGINLVEYKEYLEASLEDIKSTNNGYFAEDNSTKDEDIKNGVDLILRDKNTLLSIKNEKGEYNTLRFIFSKWTLREGWDNPNVFTIAKLRSSGSEISKLQEIGRGLRLPVDINGNRIEKEQFYLSYIIDYSEKDFANSLINEINSDVQVIHNIESQMKCLSDKYGKSIKELFLELYSKDYIDNLYNIIDANRESLFREYPELLVGVNRDKVIDRTKGEKATVKIRKNRYHEIRDLWEVLNQKYYISIEDIKQEELQNVVLNILKENIFDEEFLLSKLKKSVIKNQLVEMVDDSGKSYSLKKHFPYNEFLIRVQKQTSIPINVFHGALVEYSKEIDIIDELFNNISLKNFVTKFNEWKMEYFINRYSYRKLDIPISSTALTENNIIRETILQGNIGVHKADYNVPDNYLYDTFCYDSPLEKENIIHSDIDEVVVFGKIPRKSIKIPTYWGATTSPDFMYVIKRKDGELELNFIVETKDVDSKNDLRKDESCKIACAHQFFTAIKDDGYNVVFKEQYKRNDIVSVIKKTLSI